MGGVEMEEGRSGVGREGGNREEEVGVPGREILRIE